MMHELDIWLYAQNQASPGGPLYVDPGVLMFQLGRGIKVLTDVAAEGLAMGELDLRRGGRGGVGFNWTLNSGTGLGLSTSEQIWRCASPHGKRSGTLVGALCPSGLKKRRKPIATPRRLVPARAKSSVSATIAHDARGRVSI